MCLIDLSRSTIPQIWLDWFFRIWVHETGRSLQLIDCDLKCYFNIKSRFVSTNTTYQKADALSLFLLHFDHCSLSHSELWVDLSLVFTASPTFYIYVKMTSVNMLNVILQNMETRQNNIHLVLYVENSTWVNKDYGFINFVDAISVNIIFSQLTGTCYACPLMNIHGQGSIGYSKAKYNFVKSIVDVSHNPEVSTLSLIETSFKAQGSLQDKINTNYVVIISRNTTFIMDGSVSFTVWHIFEAQHVFIQCCTGRKAQRTLGQSGVIYTCESVCEGKTEYSLQAGKLTVSEIMACDLLVVVPNLTFYEQKLGPLEEIYIPSCLPCPLGAKCESTIETLPNYWGYENSNKSVSIFRCPDYYCCQGNDTCGRINSCNTGRTGTLCGTCEHNLTETIFTPKCVPIESCRSILVMTLFISAALVYAVVLMSFSIITNKLKYFLKKVKVKCTKKQTFSEDQMTDESGFKYMQILFYYVQDAKLFTVYLPEMDVKSENFVVKVLEFSPKILEATELCFKFSSAIIKVTVQLSFGFLVMFFLYLVYVIQLLASHFIQRQMFWNELKVRLVQAYLLTILLSYQKIAIGAFTLVQCVHIQDLTVLFIQANVECYTWWQLGILVYICISVVPIFFVLAHLPFCVKEKKMSAKVFILACLFPLPVVIGYHVLKIWNRRCSKRRNFVGNIVELPMKGTVDLDLDAGIREISEDTKRTKKREINIPEDFVENRTNDAYFYDEIIVECLMKHYKCLSMFGVRFTWLGVHKIYRVILVACKTFISEPVTRLYVMSMLVISMTAANAISKPYKDQRVNTTAILSYIANLCIAGLNLVKAHLVTFGCDTSSQYRDTVVQYMDSFENTLLLYAPLAAIVLWVVNKGLQKSLKKCK